MVVRGRGGGIQNLGHCSLYIFLYIWMLRRSSRSSINDRSPGRPIHWAPESWLKSGSQPFPLFQMWDCFGSLWGILGMFWGKHRGGGVCGGRSRYLGNVGDEFVVCCQPSLFLPSCVKSNMFSSYANALAGPAYSQASTQHRIRSKRTALRKFILEYDPWDIKSVGIVK